LIVAEIYEVALPLLVLMVLVPTATLVAQRQLAATSTRLRAAVGNAALFTLGGAAALALAGAIGVLALDYKPEGCGGASIEDQVAADVLAVAAWGAVGAASAWAIVRIGGLARGRTAGSSAVIAACYPLAVIAALYASLIAGIARTC
jgi:hypothetical protein